MTINVSVKALADKDSVIYKDGPAGVTREMELPSRLSDCAGMYMAAAVRAVSDSQISSYWSHEYKYSRSYAEFRIPRVQNGVPDMAKSRTGVVYTEAGHYEGDTAGQNDNRTEQTTLTCTVESYAERYLLQVIHNSQNSRQAASYLKCQKSEEGKQEFVLVLADPETVNGAGSSEDIRTSQVMAKGISGNIERYEDSAFRSWYQKTDEVTEIAGTTGTVDGQDALASLSARDGTALEVDGSNARMNTRPDAADYTAEISGASQAAQIYMLQFTKGNGTYYHVFYRDTSDTDLSAGYPLADSQKSDNRYADVDQAMITAPAPGEYYPSCSAYDENVYYLGDIGAGRTIGLP